MYANRQPRNPPTAPIRNPHKHVTSLDSAPNPHFVENLIITLICAMTTAPLSISSTPTSTSTQQNHMKQPPIGQHAHYHHSDNTPSHEQASRRKGKGKKKRKPNGYLGYLPNAVPKTQVANNQKTRLNSKRKSQENNRNNKTRPKSAPPNISSDAQPQSNSPKP